MTGVPERVYFNCAKRSEHMVTSSVPFAGGFEYVLASTLAAAEELHKAELAAIWGEARNVAERCCQHFERMRARSEPFLNSIDREHRHDAAMKGYGAKFVAERLAGPTDASATLAALLAEARAEGIREADEAGGMWFQFNSNGEPTGGYCTVERHDPGGMERYVKRAAILALLPEERT